MNLKNRTLTWLLALGMTFGASPVLAGPADEPEFSEMAMDVVVARPLGLAVTAIGAAVFVVSLPFSALGGNIEQAAEKLVLDPGRETFVRCLGCRTIGRYDDPND
jgi:hypothetical protein